MNAPNTLSGPVTTTKSDRGFTLIELLIVVVIIGILAAVAIPQYTSTKEKAYDATAKSDLRNLMSAQEGFLYDFGSYASTTTNLEAEEGFRKSDEVSVSIVPASPGYRADASHSGSSNCFRVEIGPGANEQIVRVPDAATGGGDCSG